MFLLFSVSSVLVNLSFELFENRIFVRGPSHFHLKFSVRKPNCSNSRDVRKPRFDCISSPCWERHIAQLQSKQMTTSKQKSCLDLKTMTVWSRDKGLKCRYKQTKYLWQTNKLHRDTLIGLKGNAVIGKRKTLMYTNIGIILGPSEMSGYRRIDVTTSGSFQSVGSTSL